MPNETSATYTYHKDKIRFESYSDARLAGFYSRNLYKMTFDQFQQILDIMTDPAFRSNEVTFKRVLDVFDHVSESRREVACKRAEAALKTDDSESGHCNPAITIGGIPPVVLYLVVDAISEQLLQFGVAAVGRKVDAAREDLRNMSFVHRTWTPIAQAALRRRALYWWHNLRIFPLRPFCGPWITEMIIMLEVVGEEDIPTSEDLQCLRDALQRVPNLRSLSLNTSFSWRFDCSPPAHKVPGSLEIIADMGSNLENLWLVHTGDRYHSLKHCDELRCLYRCLPKMRSLKFLSLREWSDERQGDDESLNWDEHPPPQLKVVEIERCQVHNDDMLVWLVKPRGDFFLESLSVDQYSAWRLRDCISSVKNLQLGPCGRQTILTQIIKKCNNLVGLDVFVDEYYGLDVTSFDLPSTLERLAIHYYDYHDGFVRFLARMSLSHAYAMKLENRSIPSGHCMPHDIYEQTSLDKLKADAQYSRGFTQTLLSLPRLKTVVISGTYGDWDCDSFCRSNIIRDMNRSATLLPDDDIPVVLLALRERDIEVTCFNNGLRDTWKEDLHKANTRDLFCFSSGYSDDFLPS